MTYESLKKLATSDLVNVFEKEMPMPIKGLYSNGTVWINRRLSTELEKGCVLAEELGHHHTSTGNILNQKELMHRKQESRARYWAFEKLVPLTAIIQAHKLGVRNRHELASFLSITEEFLNSSLKRYQEKHGLYIMIEGVTVIFEPLGVLEMFE